jgi:hypothetical protein
MKKEFGLALLALFFLSLNAITGAYAIENENKEKNTEKIDTIIKQAVDIKLLFIHIKRLSIKGYRHP